MSYRGIFWTKSKDVNMRDRYFLGISFSRIAGVFDNPKKFVAQIRVGLIWRHCGITFII